MMENPIVLQAFVDCCGNNLLGYLTYRDDQNAARGRLPENRCRVAASIRESTAADTCSCEKSFRRLGGTVMV